MIVSKWGCYTLEYDEIKGKYSVFERVFFPSGTTSHFLQKCKWYKYKGYAKKVYNRLCSGEEV